jgi:hypothetical protein
MFGDFDPYVWADQFDHRLSAGQPAQANGNLDGFARQSGWHAGGGGIAPRVDALSGRGFPDGYRGTPFLANIHGNRINNGFAQRVGMRRRIGPISVHERSHVDGHRSSGPDGGSITNWYDGDECHTQ